MKMRPNVKAYLEQNFPQLLDPTLRHDFEIVWVCLMGNPNGDPDNAGAPRQYPDGRLIVTDAALKRMIRDYLEEVYNLPIYISRTAKEQGECLKTRSAAFPTAEQAIGNYYDVRMFGAVYLAGGKKGSSESQNAQILGPVQIGMGSTQEPVEVIQTSVGRIMQEDNNQNTFGTKAWVENAEIHHKGRYSGNLGIKMGVTADDMAHLWEALLNAPELRQSSMSGERSTLRLQITSYSDPYGLGSPTLYDLSPSQD